MTLHQLAQKLKEMYEKAPYGEAVAHIHLFGIIYAKEIENGSYSVKDIIKYSGLKESYQTEVTKGMKLSKYVVVK